MYLLKITIDGIVPPIYRSIHVPETFSLNKLHHIIQIAFGWNNSRIYCFRQADVPTTNPLLWGGGVTRWDKKVKLNEVLQQVGDILPYEYDLREHWKHTIVLENIRPGLSKWARCTDGARAAPPENCGGIPGYDDLMYHLCHPEMEGYLDLFDWLGDEYDSEFFDMGMVNQKLRDLSIYIRAYEVEHGL